MITFFRRIREKLIASGSVTKYLLYALGEVLLVVIGILIALQVNNWNEERNERALEQRYLQRLVVDLDKDIENISGSIDVNKSRKERAEFLMATVDSSELAGNNPTYFIQSIEYAGYTNDPVITDHTYEEIKSSGNLSIIQSERVRAALADYHSFISNRDQYNFIRQENQLKYLEYQQGILSASQQMDMGSFRVSETYTVNEAEAVYQRMMNNPGFITWIPFTIQSKIRSTEILEGYYEQAKRLKNLIDLELETF